MAQIIKKYLLKKLAKLKFKQQFGFLIFGRQ